MRYNHHIDQNYNMEVENEIWRNISENPNYQVSNMGRVKSLERKVKNGNGYRIKKEKVLKPRNSGGGYLKVDLWEEGKMKGYLIHLLAADVFISNPYNLPQVNHRNEIKTDNRVENLEWCSQDYNNNYGTRIERITKANINNTKKSKSVICIETGKIYPSIAEIKRQFGFDIGDISRCCNGKRSKTVGKLHWKYVD